MDYLLMIPAILVLAAVVIFLLPLASRKRKPNPRAEKEQMDAPQEEFIDDSMRGGRKAKRQAGARPAD